MFGIIRGGLKQIALLGGGALIVVLLFHDAIAQAFRKDPIFQEGGRMVQQGRQLLATPTMYFAPDQNLERLDMERFRQTRTRLDISMYAFTDRALASVLKELAEKGSVIRLYRDKEQFETEQAHSHRGHPSTTDLLRGVANVHIRVKGGAGRDLMHQKGYCIDCSGGSGLLRDGSANWSVGAERYQDNSIWFTSDPRQTDEYERKFDQMWARPSNLVVQ
jgi:phosphatidylserine/phosphatidylglycerophosphate/cardiolipin synthase-like enzyme